MTDSAGENYEVVGNIPFLKQKSNRVAGVGYLKQLWQIWEEFGDAIFLSKLKRKKENAGLEAPPPRQPPPLQQPVNITDIAAPTAAAIEQSLQEAKNGGQPCSIVPFPLLSKWTTNFSMSGKLGVAHLEMFSKLLLSIFKALRSSDFSRKCDCKELLKARKLLSYALEERFDFSEPFVILT